MVVGGVGPHDTRDGRRRLGPAGIPPANTGTRVEARPFFDAWKQRENVTAYDARSVALADALDAPLVTCDTPPAMTRGHRAPIETID